MSTSTKLNGLVCAASLVACSSLAAWAAAPKKAAVPARQADSISGHYEEKTSGDTLDVKLLPGGKIKLHVFAYWPSSNPSQELRPGGPNVGETEDTIPIKNGVAIYTTSEYGGKCKITFHFIGNKVIINQEEDSMACCGYGMNVNASGTYTKLSNKPQF